MRLLFLTGLALVIAVVSYRLCRAWRLEEYPLSAKRIKWKQFEREITEDARRRIAMAQERQEL